MKTKGLNFTQVLEEMKKGKEVKRSGWASGLKFKPECGKHYIQWERSENDWVSSYEDINATDWEVVDEDKDWNWERYGAKNGNSDNTIGQDVKKMLDFIKEDMHKYLGYEHKIILKEIINKRSGLY